MKFMILLVLTLSIQSKLFGQDQVDTKNYIHQRKLFVGTSFLLESYSILSKSRTFGSPLPYFGVGHILQKNYLKAGGFLSSELGLLSLKNHYDNPPILKAPANISTNQIKYSNLWQNSKNDRLTSIRSITEETFFYYRYLDLYSTYRSMRFKTRESNNIKLNDESITSLMLSPFKWKNIKKPWVIGSIAAASLSYFVYDNSRVPLSNVKSVKMLDRDYSPKNAFKNYAGIRGLHNILVASGEEMFFRGILQTELAETGDEKEAVLLSSAAFGFSHLIVNGGRNALFATFAGTVFGYRYMNNGYDLGETIAMHFWWNFILDITEFIKSPETANFVFSISLKN